MASFKPRVDKTKLYMQLGVPFDADAAVIKSCYKRLALQCHPDRHATKTQAEKDASASKFQEVGFAYEVLSDPLKRAAYDKKGMPGVDALDSTSAPDDARQEGRDRDEEVPDAAAEQHRAKREAAYATYRAVFGHNPVVDVPREGGAAVHNMAGQRGGGSFDDVQRRRLDELFGDLNVGGGQRAPKESSSAAQGAAWEPPRGGGRGSGRYSGTSWHH